MKGVELYGRIRYSVLEAFLRAYTVPNNFGGFTKARLSGMVP